MLLPLMEGRDGQYQRFFVLLRRLLLAPKVAPEPAGVNALQQYMQSARPNVALSALTYANIALIGAKQMSGSSVQIIISESMALSSCCAALPNFRKWRWRHLPGAARRTYPGADPVIAVSHHAADESITNIGLSRQPVKIIHDRLSITLCERARKSRWTIHGEYPTRLR